MEIEAALVGAVVGVALGAIVTWFFDRRKYKQQLDMLKLQLAQGSKQHLLDETRLNAAKELLEYLSRVLNREAPTNLKKNVPELKTKWAALNRHLFLLDAPDEERSKFDERMVLYLNSLATLAKDPNAAADVEMHRDLAKKQARDLLRRLGLAASW